MHYAHFAAADWDVATSGAPLELVGAAAALFVRCVQRGQSELVEDYRFLSAALGGNVRRARRIIAQMLDAGLAMRQVRDGVAYLRFHFSPAVDSAACLSDGARSRKREAVLDRQQRRAAKKAASADRSQEAENFLPKGPKIVYVSRNNDDVCPKLDPENGENQTLSSDKKNRIENIPPNPQETDEGREGAASDQGGGDRTAKTELATADQFAALRRELEADIDSGPAAAAEPEAAPAAEPEPDAPAAEPKVAPAKQPAMQAILNRSLQRMGRLPTPRSRQAGEPAMAPVPVCRGGDASEPGVNLRSAVLVPMFNRLRLEIGDPHYDRLIRPLASAELTDHGLVLTGTAEALAAARKADAYLRRVTGVSAVQYRDE